MPLIQVCFGQKYFSCVSVPEVEDENKEEHTPMLDNARALTTDDLDYAHPEVGVLARGRRSLLLQVVGFILGQTKVVAVTTPHCTQGEIHIFFLNI